MQTTGANAIRTGSHATGVTCDPTVTDQPTASAPVCQPLGAGLRSAGTAPHRASDKTREQDLLHRARAEDVLHWQRHQRPISAETLRKRLHVGAGTARRLVAQLRSDTHVTLDSQVPQPAAP